MASVIVGSALHKFALDILLTDVSAATPKLGAGNMQMKQ
jgi:hypothetical protein